MKFPSVLCPKCGSADTAFFRDRDAMGLGYPHDATFRCGACAFRIFGLAALSFAGEVLAKAEVEQGERLARERLEDARLEVVRLKGAVQEQERLDRLAEEREQSSFAEGGKCSWKGCPQEKRSNSMYCSRGCSNKNARWRHQQRVE